MRRVLTALAALAVAAPAVAADLNRPKTTAPTAWPTTTTQAGSLKDPVYKPKTKNSIFDGAFGGFNLSYGMGKSEVSYSLPGVSSNLGTRKLKPRGMLGGVTVGYNWRPKKEFLIGVVGDFGMSDMDATDKAVFGNANTLSLGQSRSTFGPTFGMIRGRLGWVKNDIFMIYGTFGQAWFSANQFEQAGAFIGENSGPKSLNGIVYGGGVEIAMTEKTALGIEYMRADLGSENTLVPIASFLNVNSRFKNRMDQIKVGMKYKF